MTLVEIKIILKDLFGESIYLDRYIKLLESVVCENVSIYDYYEFHHILPRSLFKNYITKKWNIIQVPGKMHYILHYLLVKLSKQNVSMLSAFTNMRRLQVNKKPNCALYASCKKFFCEAQKRRKHFYNVKTGESKFTFKVPKGVGWVYGFNPKHFKNRKYRKYRWIHDPKTKQSVHMFCDEDIPDGWECGRYIENNPLLILNNKIRVFNMKTMKYEYVTNIKNWHIKKFNTTTRITHFIIYNNVVLTSLKHLFYMFGCTYHYRFIKSFTNHELFVFPKPTKKFKNIEWIDFCNKNCGKTLKDIGVNIIKYSDFKYNNSMVGI